MAQRSTSCRDKTQPLLVQDKQGHPFDNLVPNEETERAMKAARRGDVVKVGGVNDLLADLQTEDRTPQV